MLNYLDKLKINHYFADNAAILLFKLSSKLFKTLIYAFN